MSCGTVQARSLPGLSFSSDKDLQAKGRGAFEEWITNSEGEVVTVVKWYDNRAVHLMLTFAKAESVLQKERYDRKIKARVVIDCPTIVHEYNQNMGGVDLHDQLISLYRL